MIGIGLIGCGAWGVNYLKTLVSIPEIKVLYVCDLKKEILDNVRAIYPYLKLTGDYRDLLNDNNVGGVIIATPPKSHYQLASKFLAGNKAVLVEKPVTHRYREAKELAQLARKNNTILMAGHLMEYHPVVKKLREYISRGMLGELRYILLDRANLGKIRTDVSVLWDLAVHDLSIVRSLINQEPLWVSAQGGNYLQEGIWDLITVTMGFTGNLMVQIHANWMHPVKKRHVAIAGNNMMAFWDDTRDKNKLQIISYNVDIVTPELENTLPLTEQCRHFINCVKTGKEPQTGLQDILWVMRLLDLTEQSLLSHGARLYFRSDR
ncbi:dehydrogenases and related proteins [Desulfocucumis palustris]|uniref:Dehydrogenases and related proteins n=1 Tax=Desulfocucumis palustris TaxID=1898651 RepID=A0A2L2XBJ6_9FIRM|nr:Gfo/Idh/MocA family oxidoreductase [Desulfocucumis palustris]GBF33452.1 dehydrogenases and related proteins [Desulfocucumis palustris]